MAIVAETSTDVEPIKLAAAAALAAATEHIAHERAELAQLECLGNRVHTGENPETNDARTYPSCTGATCEPYAANEDDCTKDGRLSTDGNIGAKVACAWSAGDLTGVYQKPVYGTTAKTTNCTAPKVPGITTLPSAIEAGSAIAGSMPSKPALGIILAADGL